jgi:hypothetical protein
MIPLDTKELLVYPELSEMMNTVVKTVNNIKIRPLKSRLFAELSEKMGKEYQLLLFYCNSCWLSIANVVTSVYNLRQDVALFLEEESLVHAEHFVFKLAHLSDIFW